MACWYGQKCGLGKGLSLSVICQAGEIALTCARKSFYICWPVFHKFWFMLLKYNFDFTGFILCEKIEGV